MFSILTRTQFKMATDQFLSIMFQIVKRETFEKCTLFSIFLILLHLYIYMFYVL